MRGLVIHCTSKVLAASVEFIVRVLNSRLEFKFLASAEVTILSVESRALTIFFERVGVPTRSL